MLKRLKIVPNFLKMPHLCQLICKNAISLYSIKNPPGILPQLRGLLLSSKNKPWMKKEMKIFRHLWLLKKLRSCSKPPIPSQCQLTLPCKFDNIKGSLNDPQWRLVLGYVNHPALQGKVYNFYPLRYRSSNEVNSFISFYWYVLAFRLQSDWDIPWHWLLRIQGLDPFWGSCLILGLPHSFVWFIAHSRVFLYLFRWFPWFILAVFLSFFCFLRAN